MCISQHSCGSGFVRHCWHCLVPPEILNDKFLILNNLRLYTGTYTEFILLSISLILSYCSKNRKIKILFFSIGIQVVRLVGRERALRPVLEALFHRILLLPTPAKRLEPLRAAKELLRSPARLVDLLLLNGSLHKHAGDDMAIIRL